MKLLQFIGLMVFCFLFQSYNAYASVQVNSVTPRIIKLESNKVVTLSLRGRGLNAIKGAALHRDKGARQAVSGLVGKFSGSATSGKLMLTFRGKARSGNYYVHVTDGRKAIALLPVSVKVAAASVAKRPTMRRNPILERKRPAVARKAIARAVTRVTSAMPRTVQLTAGKPVSISLRGSGLNAIKGAALHRDKGARQAVSGLVGKFSGSATSGKLMLTFRGKARSGNYYVHVTDGRKAIALLPVTVKLVGKSIVRRTVQARNGLANVRKRVTPQKTGLAQRKASDARKNVLAQRKAATHSAKGALISVSGELKRNDSNLTLPSPRITSFSINHGAQETMNKIVKLDHVVVSREGITHYRFLTQDIDALSDGPNQIPDDSQWKPYRKNITIDITQAAGDVKTVWFQVKAGNQMSNVVSDSIHYENPKISNFKINGGAAKTYSRQMQLTWNQQGYNIDWSKVECRVLIHVGKMNPAGSFDFHEFGRTYCRQNVGVLIPELSATSKITIKFMMSDTSSGSVWTNSSSREVEDTIDYIRLEDSVLNSFNAYNQAKIAGFGFSSKAKTPNTKCELSIDPVEGGLKLNAVKSTFLGEATCEFNLFANRNLKPGWTFNNYSPVVVTGSHFKVLKKPEFGATNLNLKVRVTSNYPLTQGGAVLEPIRLRGPDDGSPAF